MDRRREVPVGGLVAGNGTADPGQDMQEIQVIGPSDHPVLRHGKFQDDGFSTGLHDAEELCQPLFLVLEIPNSKGAGDTVERPFPIRKRLPVSDLQALENYLLNNLHGNVAEPYDHPQGRILIQSHDKRERTGVRPTSKIKINRLASTDPDDEFYNVKAEDFQKSHNQKSDNKPTVAPRQ